jgi:hypothetical protein
MMFPVSHIVIDSAGDRVEEKTIQESNGYVSELDCLTSWLMLQLRMAKIKLKLMLPRGMNLPSCFHKTSVL